jgi:hypothetical protein
MTGSHRWPAHRWRVLALLGAAFFMTILDGTSLLTALRRVVGEHIREQAA